MDAGLLTRLEGQIQQQEHDAALSLVADLPLFEIDHIQLTQLLEIMGKIPWEIGAASVEFCYRSALLKLMAGDMNSARKWQNALTAHRESLSDGSPERKLLENRIFCLGIAMPQGQNANFLMNLAILSHEYADASFPLAKLSATRGIPSVLRGAKDFSSLGKHHRASASIVQPLLGSLLQDSKGVCEIGIAEILYEQNDLNGATMEVVGAINANDPEILFAGYALLARIGAADTTARPPEEILAHIGAMIEEKNASWLTLNYEALKIRYAMLKGDSAAVREWVEHSDINDLNICIPLDYYRILTKITAYLSLGEYRAAATLAEHLNAALEGDYRPLDSIESMVSSAIAFAALGSLEHALNKLEKALLLAQEFSYVRVIADHGNAVVRLLEQYMAEDRSIHEDLRRDYVEKVLDVAKGFAAAWPALLSVPGQPAPEAPSDEPPAPENDAGLTQSELQILQLIDRGLSNSKVSKQLHIEVSTVKFHASNIYKKLEASGRVEALNAARKLGILK